MQRSSMVKKDFDHVDFAVAARNEKLRYYTTPLAESCIFGLRTSNDRAEEALLSFLPFVHSIQKSSIKYEAKIPVR